MAQIVTSLNGGDTLRHEGTFQSPGQFLAAQYTNKARLRDSPREQEVMLHVTAGKMNKQVAGDLGISEITVKIHRGAAMHKMGTRTHAELVRMADVLKPNRRKLGR
jgi:FixJ family two-component response regulator